LAQLAGLTITLAAGTLSTTMNVVATATETTTGATAVTNGSIFVNPLATGFVVVGVPVAELMTGGTSGDTLIGSLGADTLNGGGGNDIASYLTSPTAVTINLLTGVNSGGFAAGDLLTSIETVEGSAFADHMTGDNADNIFLGGGGNDYLDGGTGIDTLTGGAGDDVYVVDVAGDSVVEGAGSGMDEIRTTLTTYSIATLSDVENLTFTGAGASTLTGNAAANLIIGGTGNDTVSGGTANDTLMGGAGADSLSGGNDNDLMIGGQGADTLAGGVGVDTFRYFAGDATATDTITDFTAGVGGDVIDIDGLLTGYDNNPLTLTSYVNLVEAGGNTTLRIDPTGTSNFTVTVLTLTGVTGLDLATLRTNGNLVT
jgi:Ca2+-binding RTX toxin-like protein